MGYKAGFIAVCLVVLCGCTPKIVNVPVNTCPEPEIGENPVLPIGALQEDADIAMVLQAFSASLELCKGRVRELTLKLKGYQLVH